MEAHPAAIKQVLRPFRVAFTGGRSKTFISYLADKIETTDKVGWSPERSRGRRGGAETGRRVGVGACRRFLLRNRTGGTVPWRGSHGVHQNFSATNSNFPPL